MSELRVPTMAVPVEITCADGRTFSGRVFIPAQSSRHDGPMRPEEWLNEGQAFFPFLPDGGGPPVVMNKRELLIVTVPAEAEEEAGEAVATVTRRQVVVECEDRRLEGELAIDMPENKSRVLDYLNRAEAFVMLRGGERNHLVQKERITRVVEEREG